jgi:hypothetical protein
VDLDCANRLSLFLIHCGQQQSLAALNAVRDAKPEV